MMAPIINFKNFAKHAQRFVESSVAVCCLEVYVRPTSDPLTSDCGVVGVAMLEVKAREDELGCHANR